MHEIRVANVLLEIEAVRFSPYTPITFKSGIKSPIYVDNRIIPYWPEQWHTVITGFQYLTGNLEFEVIAGIETAGIPHGAALAYSLYKPSVFVRKQPKEHGTQSRIEGGAVAGKRVLLVEDLVTTGGSSLSGVAALRAAGAALTDCLTIVSYGFEEAHTAFKNAGVHLHTLTTFKTITQQALEMGKFTSDEMTIILDWLQDPHGWAARHHL